jgi:hypothetical protein
MATNNVPERLKVGDRVKILNSGFTKGGKIVEFRGPLGPGGALIYRVRVRGKPNPAYGEFREDQLGIYYGQEVRGRGSGNRSDGSRPSRGVCYAASFRRPCSVLLAQPPDGTRTSRKPR